MYIIDTELVKLLRNEADARVLMREPNLVDMLRRAADRIMILNSECADLDPNKNFIGIK